MLCTVTGRETTTEFIYGYITSPGAALRRNNIEPIRETLKN